MPEIYWTYLSYNGNILNIYCEYTGHILGIYWTYTRNILDIYWEYTGDIQWINTGDILGYTEYILGTFL